MLDTSETKILQVIENQSLYFRSHQTKDIRFRLEQLRKLKKVIQKYQVEIERALWEDLHKSPEEAYLTEISIVLSEINHHIRNLKYWARPVKVSTPIALFPSKSHIHFEPLGLSLIIAPWNYPFQLVMNPLIGAISSGCCAILKPSPDASATASLIEKLIHETFDPAYVSVVQGGREVNEILLKQRFDLIFFTGSSKVGKVVMRAAAENLTPVILELGGKSPCIVDKDANLDLAAKRIAWGKWMNAGQTCIAPDYVFVHESVKDVLLQKLVTQIQKTFGENSEQSRFYPRIVNSSAFERLESLLQNAEIFWGGKRDKANLFISPTILDNTSPTDPIMQDEIFGPILPILTFQQLEEALDYINKNEKPLAFYFFGKNKQGKDVLHRSSSGGVCINDTLLHIANHNLPFGGVGNSGLGKYHGHESFMAFSNKRGVVQSSTWFDLPFKYVPFKGFRWLKKIV